MVTVKLREANIYTLKEIVSCDRKSSYAIHPFGQTIRKDEKTRNSVTFVTYVTF